MGNPATSPSTDNLTLGTADLYYRAAGLAEGAAYSLLGNLPSIGVKVDHEEKKHFDSQTFEMDKVLYFRRGLSFALTGDEISDENFLQLTGESAIATATGYTQVPIGNTKQWPEVECQLEHTMPTGVTLVVHLWRATIVAEDLLKFSDNWAEWSATISALRSTTHTTDGMIFGYIRWYNSGVTPSRS